MPEFARVTADAGERRTADDDARADPGRAAVEVDQVGGAAAGTEQPLGVGAEARVVGREHRVAGGRRELGSERLLGPLQVRGEPYDAVLLPDQTRNGHADPDDAGGLGQRGTQPVDHGGDDRDGLRRRRDVAGRVAHSARAPGASSPTIATVTASTSGLTARATTRPLGATTRRRAGRPIAGRGLALLHESEFGEFGDQSADSRAVEPVAWVSAERASGPSRCTSPSTVARLCRRTVSRFVPVVLPFIFP